MNKISPQISELNADGLIAHLDDLCRILVDSVADGAAVSFLTPLPRAKAQEFWTETVHPAVAKGDRSLFGAFIGDRLVGTAQLIVTMPPSQPNRAEIAKMIVHPDGRRRGLASALMTRALDAARQAGKTLVTLDTRIGDVAEAMYQTMGFIKAGVIPDFALDPDGRALHANTYMYRQL